MSVLDIQFIQPLCDNCKEVKRLINVKAEKSTKDVRFGFVHLSQLEVRIFGVFMNFMET